MSCDYFIIMITSLHTVYISQYYNNHLTVASVHVCVGYLMYKK